MKLELTRNGMKIIPTQPHELAFLEDTMNLRRDGDTIIFVRHDQRYGTGVVLISDTLTQERNDIMLNKKYEVKLSSQKDEDELKKFMASKMPNATLTTVAQPENKVEESKELEYGLLLEG